MGQHGASVKPGTKEFARVFDRVICADCLRVSVVECEGAANLE